MTNLIDLFKADVLIEEGDAYFDLNADGDTICHLPYYSHGRMNEHTINLSDLVRSSEAMSAARVIELEAEVERLRGALRLQPIETAPKDGTQIIGAWEYGGWSYEVMMWRGAWSKRFNAMCEFKPTHWAPLPATPEQDGK